jgi:hypothetical protein
MSKIVLGVGAAAAALGTLATLALVLGTRLQSARWPGILAAPEGGSSLSIGDRPAKTLARPAQQALDGLRVATLAAARERAAARSRASARPAARATAPSPAAGTRTPAPAPGDGPAL